MTALKLNSLDLRSYQKECLDKAMKFYKKGRVFRIDACTGAGKTVMATAIAKKFDNVIFVCHTNNLKNQLKAAVDFNHQGIFSESAPENWHYYVYQTLRVKTQIDHPQVDLLIIDEAHQGGQTKKELKGSYKKIIENLNPGKILILSATDYNLDEDLFGKKTAQNTFSFNYMAAIEHNILNSCELITLHTGLSQYLSDGSVIEEESLKELGKKDKDRHVNLREEQSKKAILKAHLGWAAERYFLDECDLVNGICPQAVFFVTDASQASLLKEMLLDRKSYHFRNNKKLEPKAISFVREVHTGIVDNENVPVTESTSSEDIEAFKRGEFACMITIRQVQEGFDYPDLELIFDCSPSFSNNARVFIQRLGRCLRRKKGKKVSRYYMLHKISSVSIKCDGEKQMQDGLAKLNPFVNAARDEHLAIAATVNMALKNDNTDSPITERDIEVDTTSFEPGEEHDAPSFFAKLTSFLKEHTPKKCVSKRSSLIINEADGGREVHRTTLERALTEAHGEWVYFTTAQEFADWILKREELNIKSLSEWKKAHCASYTAAYKLDLQRKVGDLLEWKMLTKPSVEQNIQEIKEYYLKYGKKPSSKTKLGAVCKKYCSDKSGIFRQDLVDWFNENGYLSNRVEQNIQEIKEYYLKYGKKPSSKTKLGAVCASYCTKGEMFRQDLVDWFNENGYLNLSAKKQIRHKESGQVFESISKAAKYFEINDGYLSSHLKGKYKHVKGHTFEYVE